MWDSGPLAVYGSAVTAGSTTTLNPASIFECVLSNGNLTATHDAIQDNWACAFSTTTSTTGKKYCEVVTTVGDSNNGFIGVADAAFVAAMSGGTNLGGNTGGNRKSVGYGYNGAVQIEGSNLTGSPIQGQVLNHIVAVAVDFSAKLIWYKDLTAGSNWNNTGGADPATGTGGLDISQLTNSPFSFAVGPGFDHTSGANYTVNFGGSAYTGSVPSGFSNW